MTKNINYDEKYNFSWEKLKNSIILIMKKYQYYILVPTSITTLLVLLSENTKILLSIPFVQEGNKYLLITISKFPFRGILSSISILLGTLWLIQKGQNDKETIIIAESINGIPGWINELRSYCKKLFSKQNSEAGIATIVGLSLGFFNLIGIVLLTIIAFSLTTKNKTGRINTILTQRYVFFTSITKKFPYRRIGIFVAGIIRSFLNDYNKKISTMSEIDPILRLLIAILWVGIHVFGLYTIVFVHRKLVTEKNK